MPRHRSTLQRTLGQLILAVQKEETLAMVDSALWDAAKEARARAESLLALAGDPARLRRTLGGGTVGAYVGARWIAKHPSVKPALLAVSKALNESDV